MLADGLASQQEANRYHNSTTETKNVDCYQLIKQVRRRPESSVYEYCVTIAEQTSVCFVMHWRSQEFGFWEGKLRLLLSPLPLPTSFLPSLEFPWGLRLFSNLEHKWGHVSLATPLCYHEQ
jgi:hypothetical protein